MKLLVVIAGPNGSGKSTIVNGIRVESSFPQNYINPDEIIREKAFADIPDEAERYGAAMDYAATRRQECIASGESLAFETVMSRRDKIEFMKVAKDYGYRVELVFVTTCDPVINKARVKKRVAGGGHDVPPGKIEERYYRSMNLLAEAVRIADEARVYDNSEAHPRLVFHKPYHLDVWLEDSQTRPSWVDEYLVQPLQQSGELPLLGLQQHK